MRVFHYVIKKLFSPQFLVLYHNFPFKLESHWPLVLKQYYYNAILCDNCRYSKITNQFLITLTIKNQYGKRHCKIWTNSQREMLPSFNLMADSSVINQKKNHKQQLCLMKIPPVTLRADYMYDALKGDQAIHRFVAVRILVTTSLVFHCSYIILWNCMGKAL